MLFKGTSRRPKASDISRELDSIGALYNAFTSRECTGYYVKSDAKHTDLVLDILSDMYTDPIFDKAEMEKERGVIIEEIRMYNDLPQRHVHDIFASLLYGDQPAGREIAGTENSVRSFDRDQLKDYKKQHYTLESTTIVVAGSFDETRILSKIEKSFASISDAHRPPKEPVKESQSSPAIVLSYKETDQTHLVIGVRTFSVTDPCMPAMDVLSTILSGGMSSRLFAKMRDELGICYYIRANHEAQTDYGFLSISAGLDNSRVEEGIRGILGECRKLTSDLIPEIELQKAKDYIAGTLMLDMETSDSRAHLAAYSEALKHVVETPEEIITKIRAVTVEQVRDLAREIFIDAHLNMAMIGRSRDESVFRHFFTFNS